jgi:broad specificity phosphatase PhoE
MRRSASLVIRTPHCDVRTPRVGESGTTAQEQIVSEPLPVVYLARHGETAWSLSGQHTGRTDLPLTARGEQQAGVLGQRLRGASFVKAFTSLSQRARRTAELAGFGGLAEIDPDLAEWDYGQYEGRRTADILAERPGWFLFRDGAPGGETPDQVAARADRVIQRIRAIGGKVVIFSSAHILRVLAARWLGLDAAGGRYFVLGTSSLSILGYEHNLAEPVIRLWNETHQPE